MGSRNRHSELTILGCVIAFAVLIQWAPVRPETRTAIDDIGITAASTMALVACVTAWRRTAGKERRAWMIVSLALAGQAFGDVAWTWLEVVRGQEVPFPSVADGGYLLAPTLLIVGLVTLVETPAATLSRARGVVEAGIITLAGLFVSWHFVLGNLFADPEASPFTQLIGLAYPVLDVLGIGAAIFAVTRTGSPQRRSIVWRLGGALVALGVADSAFLYFTANGEYGGTQLIDALWFTASLLVIAAAREHSEAPREARSERTERLLLTVPFLPLVLVAGIAGARMWGGQGLDEFLIWIAIGIVVLVSIHQLSVTFENHALTRHLEHRVEERTAELATKEQHFRSLIQQSSDVVVVLDEDLRIRSVSESLTRVFGHRPDDVIGHPVNGLLEAPQGALISTALKRLTPGKTVTLEFKVRHRDGGLRHAETTATNLVDHPAVAGYVLNTRDITERHQLESELRHQAFHDSLTGLANRALFRDRVEHSVQQSPRRGAPCAVLFVDVDNFKTVNDSLGHQAGDQLLTQVAQRILSAVRPGDTVARLGGDEFAVLLEDVRCEDDAVEVALRVLDRFDPPLRIHADLELAVGVSIGVALQGTGDGTEEILRNADTAMYAAKATGRRRYSVFTPDMYEDARAHLGLLADLRTAIDGREFVLHYQPEVDLTTGTLVGFEALVRWNHPRQGLLPPNSFIPLAEESGLIIPLGRWVLREACLQLAAWDDRFDARDLVMSVNLSAIQFQYEGLVDDVAGILQISGLAPGRLLLEITETELMVQGHVTLDKLQSLRDLGVRIAIDDFGTGYSSLAYLQSLPIDVLKVDRSFVSALASGDDAGNFLRAVLHIGETLHLQTVAEGIETEGELDELLGTTCDVGQGFLLARPLDVLAAELLLSDPPTFPRRSPAPAVVHRR